MPPKSRRMSLRFVFRGVSRYLCKHPSASPRFSEKSGNRHPAPKSCASPTQSETGYLLPSPRAEPYPLPSESGHRPDSNPFHTFYYGKTRKTRHPLHGHAARPRSECRRYPQVAHNLRFPGRPRLASGGLYRPHPPGRQRRTARSQQRRPHGRSLGDHQRRLRLQRHQPPHRIRRRSRRRRHDPLRYPHSAAKERPRTLRPGFRRPISRRSRRRA